MDRGLRGILHGARPQVKRPYVDSLHLHPTLGGKHKATQKAHLWAMAMADSMGNVQGSITYDMTLTGKKS